MFLDFPFKQLSLQQLTGVASGTIWALGAGFALFPILNLTFGIRVSLNIEEEDLDIYEHGESTYNKEVSIINH